MWKLTLLTVVGLTALTLTPASEPRLNASHVSCVQQCPAAVEVRFVLVHAPQNVGHNGSVAYRMILPDGSTRDGHATFQKRTGDVLHYGDVVQMEDCADGTYGVVDASVTLGLVDGSTLSFTLANPRDFEVVDCCCSVSTPTATPTPTPEPTATSTPTATPTATPTPTSTPTATPTPAPDPTPTPDPTETPDPPARDPTPTSDPTETPDPLAQPTATSVPPHTPEPVPTSTPKPKTAILGESPAAATPTPVPALLPMTGVSSPRGRVCLALPLICTLIAVRALRVALARRD